GTRVGTARFVAPGCIPLDIVVEPKITNADFLQMLEVSHSFFGVGVEDARAYEGRGNLSLFLVQYVVERIWAFLSRGHYRDYSLTYDAASRKPRGRLDVRAYSAQSAARLRLDVMP